MSKALTKPSRCILMRSGAEMWVDDEAMEKLSEVMRGKIPEGLRFIELPSGEFVSVVDIEGVYLPNTIEDKHHRKSNDWVCNYGKWHVRKDTCGCYYDKKK